MNEVEEVAGNRIHDLVEKGREKLAVARDDANNGLESAATCVRSYPWAAVGIAVVAGMVLAVLVNRPKQKKQHLDAVKGWLEDAYSKIPEKSEICLAVDSSCASSLLKSLGKKLHLL